MKLCSGALAAIILAGCLVCAELACQSHPSPVNHPPATNPVAAAAFTPVFKPGLPNAHIVRAHLIAGAQPEGDEGFQSLKDLGIKTIISVDGSAPDVETAKKFGLRYVHLPITYSTVTDEQGKEIAKAIDELPGPIYLHCHHGKHRAAAAVAVACVMDGSLKPEQARSVLQTFGTGEDYTGLWKAAEDARPVDPREIRDTNVKFVETQKLPELADSMVLMDAQFDRMKEIEKAGWKTPPHHPDLDPPHEALQLMEHFRELQRMQAIQQKPADFRQKLAEAEKASTALRETLLANPIDIQKTEAAFKLVGNACANCHAKYRNLPPKK
jgi:protein tyrosine phosphatase (PTP) superfamily phosphohydrolase (DUF442 family)